MAFRPFINRCCGTHLRLNYVPRRTLIIETIQHGLISIHETTGLEWWSTFFLSAITVRTSALPLIYYQLLTAEKLKKAAPELSYLNTLLKRKLQGGTELSEKISNIPIFLSGTRASLRLHDVKLRCLVAPFSQIPLFACVVMSIRDLVSTGGLGLDIGGIGPFLDLTVVDSSLLLPLAAVSSTYINLELSMGNYFKPKTEKEGEVSEEEKQSIEFEGDKSTFLLKVKDVIQTGILISLPLISTLPTGAFIFWITSSLFTTVQITATRNTKFRKLIGLKS